MSRVHDMGGRFGDGAIVPEEQGIPRLQDWQERALALTLAAGALGQWNIDTSRHARECLAPMDYARFSYFEKWLAGLADILVDSGVLSADDLRGAPPRTTPHPLADRKLPAAAVTGVLSKGGPSLRDGGPPPRFKIGQAVQTRCPGGNARVAGGHTRLPAYATGVTGRILRYHGAHVLPDSNAHGLGEAPEPLYAVALPATAVWTEVENPRDEVVLDMWQSYLEPA